VAANRKNREGWALKYENPQIREGINVTQESALKELLIIGGGIVAVVAAVVFTLGLAAGAIAGWIPFEYEKQIVAGYPRPPVTNAAVNEYLQELASELAEAQGLPPEMTITVHYLDADTVNAYATLGGNIILYRGLLERLPNENALAMVISHEIAHVRLRHPIVSLGRGVVVGLALAAMTGMAGNDVAGAALGTAGLLTSLTFSRGQEDDADAAGLGAVAQRYGHVSGAEELFEVFLAMEKEKGTRMPQFLNTHPNTDMRILNIRDMARERGWAIDRAVTPLPDEFLAALRNGAVQEK